MTRPSDAARGSANNGSPGSAPDGRRPPVAPRGGPPPGAPRPPGPGFPLPPPPVRRLTSAQGVRLGLVWLVIVVLGAAAGMAFTLPMTKLYAARVVVQYDVSTQDASDFLRTDRALTTQSVLLTSRSVIGPVAQANGISPDDLEHSTTATVLTNTDLVQLNVLNADRSTGVKLAGDIAQQYLKVTAQSSPAVYLQQQIDAARSQLAAGGANAGDLQTRITTLQGQLDIQNTEGDRAAIATPAYSVDGVASPNQLLAAASGGLCGIVLACLVVIALSRRWTRG
jgi:uncharacterized protein involved in exopolysaccharide biosynthesis